MGYGEGGLEKRMDALLRSMEQLGLDEYLRYTRNRKRLFWVNLTAGMARGLGIAIGFTVLGAALIALLQRLIVSELPGISSFLADMIRIIQSKI